MVDTLIDKSEKKILRNEKGQLMPGTAACNPLGKKEGTRHKANLIKQAFFEAFEKTGGVKGLIQWINENRLNKREFYKMLLMILPKEMDVTNEDGAKLILIRAGDKLENRVEVAVIDGVKSTPDLPGAETATVVEANNPPPKI